MAISIKDLSTVGILMLIVLFLMYAFGFTVSLPDINFPSREINEDTNWVYEVEKIIALGYQLDVEVNSSHIAKHPESSKALRCLSNNGNVAAFSERISRRIHLLCWDEKTQTLYDIIINRINYFVDKYANPKSNLITAYSPQTQGGTLFEKLNWYLNHLSDTIGGKIVNLKFGPGEVFFSPK